MLSLLLESRKFSEWDIVVMRDLRSLKVRAQGIVDSELQGGNEEVRWLVAGVLSQISEQCVRIRGMGVVAVEGGRFGVGVARGEEGRMAVLYQRARCGLNKQCSRENKNVVALAHHQPPIEGWRRRGPTTTTTHKITK